MKQLVPTFVFSVLLSTTLTAEARTAPDGFSEPTFSYSQVGFKYGFIDLKDDLPTLDGTYDKLDAFEFDGSVQIRQNLFIGAEFNRAHEDKARTEATASSASVFLGMPLDASDQVDLVPTLGIGRFDIEGCFDSVCASGNDTAAVFGAELRVFAIPDIAEVTLGVHDNTLEGSDPYFTIGLAGWASGAHRVGFEYTDAEGIRALSLGYSHHW